MTRASTGSCSKASKKPLPASKPVPSRPRVTPRSKRKPSTR
ncbi:Uncharacterised protein [Bordetella pertussis]|nr:Uncharacterised protein [Bordetella pertussis]